MHEASEAFQPTTPMVAVALLIFLGSYGLIVSEKIHRTITSIFASALILLVGTLMGFYNQEEAVSHIDFNTIGLLIGMMIIVTISKDTGLFQYVAIKAAKLVKGDPWKILVIFSLITAFFSAFLDNVTTVLLMVPMTFVVCNHLKINPIPFLVSQILMSNIGGTATLIGDPPNILIGSEAGLSFMQFLTNLGPVIVIITIVILFLFKFIYKKKLKADKECIKGIMELKEKRSLKNIPLLKKSLFVLALTLIGFLFHGALHLEAATIALFGAGLLLILDRQNPEKVLEEVEWGTIFFFAGLFVLVGALVEVEVISKIAGWLIELTQGSLALTSGLMLWGGALFSTFVNNIPFVATIIPMIEIMENQFPNDINTIWWALALGACLGGNGTLVGASSNLIVAGMSEKAGYKISFKDFMKIGFTVMLISIAIAHLYLIVRYL